MTKRAFELGCNATSICIAVSLLFTTKDFWMVLAASAFLLVAFLRFFHFLEQPASNRP